MTHRPIRTIIKNQKILTAPSTTTVSEAARLMRDHKTGALMVCAKKRLVGVFTERDALFRITAEEYDPKITLLADVMTPNHRPRQTTRACAAHDVRGRVSQ